jgi:hypothetical protein
MLRGFPADHSFHWLRYHNSSFGWDPPAKKRELFDRQSRFILAQDTRHNDEGRKLLVGFIMFRFERENNEDVVYW